MSTVVVAREPVTVLVIATAPSGGGAVDSVNGKTGVVVLDHDDVGALSAATFGEHLEAEDPHGDRAYADAELAAHVAASDPHPVYQRKSERNAAGGYAGLDPSSKLSGAQQLYGSTPNTACEGNDARLSDARAPLSHAHGAITNSGAIGSTSGLPIKTGSSGVLEAGAFGSGVGEFCAGNDSRLPASGEKSALAGTSGTPGAANKYVTDGDARNTNARTPTDDSVTLAKLSPFLRVFGHRNARRVYETRARNTANTRLLIGGGGAPALSGTIGNSTLSADGVMQTWTTAASANAIAGGLLHDDECSVLRSLGPRFLCRIKASPSSTSLRIFAGFSDAALGAADDPATPAAVFRYSTSAGDPGWVCVTRSTGLTVSGSVRAYTPSEILLMGIDFEDTGTARFWLGTSESDIAVVHTTQSNLFNAASAVSMMIGVGAVAASARAISFDRAALII